MQKKIEKIEIKRIHDPHTDLSYLGEFSDTEGEFAIEHHGERGTYKYFNADNVENMEQAKQNYERMMKYEHGDLADYGVRAEAEVHTSVDGGGNWLINNLTSGGIWGNPSDASESEFKSLENTELDELKKVLKAFGFSEDEIEKAPVIRKGFEGNYAGGGKLTEKEIIEEAKRVKKQYEKETGQTFPLEYFIEQVKEKNKMAGGGKIKNQYEGKTAEQIWNAWTPEQRQHFIIDHEVLKDFWKKGNDVSTKRWDELPDDVNGVYIKGVIDNHIRTGQYGKGGEIWKEYDFDTKEEFFDYIHKSKINGNFSQLDRLWNELSTSQKREWMAYARSMGYTETINYINDELIMSEGGKLVLHNWYNIAGLPHINKHDNYRYYGNRDGVYVFMSENHFEQLLTEEQIKKANIMQSLSIAGGGKIKPMRYGKEFHKYNIGDRVLVKGVGIGIIRDYQTSIVDSKEIPSYWIEFDKSVHSDGHSRNIWESSIQDKMENGGKISENDMAYSIERLAKKSDLEGLAVISNLVLGTDYVADDLEEDDGDKVFLEIKKRLYEMPSKELKRIYYELEKENLFEIGGLMARGGKVDMSAVKSYLYNLKEKDLIQIAEQYLGEEDISYDYAVQWADGLSKSEAKDIWNQMQGIKAVGGAVGDNWYKVSVPINSENEFISILDENGMNERNFVEYENDSGMEYAMYEVYVKDEKQYKILKRNVDVIKPQYARGGKITEEWKEVFDSGDTQYYIRSWGKVHTDKTENIEIVAVATIRNLEDYISEEELPEEGNFQLEITLSPSEKFISKKLKENANDENNSISDNTIVNVINYMGGLNYNPQNEIHFKTAEKALKYLKSKEVNDLISGQGMLSGFTMDKYYNRAGNTNWDILRYMIGEKEEMFADGGSTFVPQSRGMRLVSKGGEPYFYKKGNVVILDPQAGYFLDYLQSSGLDVNVVDDYTINVEGGYTLCRINFFDPRYYVKN